MHTSIKTIITLMILVVTFQSCDQGLSLQSYYVNNELAPGFTSLDVPISMLNIPEDSLTQEQKEAYESVEKLSMLAFLKDDSNQTDYEAEIAKVKAILEDAKYEELMRGGNSTDGKFVVKCIGDGDDVDEFILFGTSKETGFAVVRVLGDDMNFNKIMKLTSVLENGDFKGSQLDKISEFFK